MLKKYYRVLRLSVEKFHPWFFLCNELSYHINIIIANVIIFAIDLINCIIYELHCIDIYEL